MIILLAQDTAYPSPNDPLRLNKFPNKLITFMERRGFTKFRNISYKSSYLAVYHVPFKRTLFEKVSPNTDIFMVSEGKNPVMDASFTRISGSPGSKKYIDSDKYFTHQTYSILYDLILKKYKKSNPRLLDLPFTGNSLNIPPFSERVDSAIEYPRSLIESKDFIIITRGNLWLKYRIVGPDKGPIGEPGMFGKGILPLLFKPKKNKDGSINNNLIDPIFKSGIDASFTHGNFIYIFRGNRWAKLDPNFQLRNKNADQGVIGIDAPFKNLAPSKSDNNIQVNAFMSKLKDLQK